MMVKQAGGFGASTYPDPQRALDGSVRGINVIVNANKTNLYAIFEGQTIGRALLSRVADESANVRAQALSRGEETNESEAFSLMLGKLVGESQTYARLVLNGDLYVKRLRRNCTGNVAVRIH